MDKKSVPNRDIHSRGWDSDRNSTGTIAKLSESGQLIKSNIPQGKLQRTCSDILMYAKTDEKQVYAVIVLYLSGACSKDTLSQTVSSRW